MKHKVRIGSKIKLLNENGQYSKWVNRRWIVTDIVKSRNEHQAYDESFSPEYLMSCEGLPVSVYESEVRVVEY